MDGIGIQSHFRGGNSKIYQSIERAIKTIVKLSEVMRHPLDIQVTELDMENYGNNDAMLASFYGEAFRAYRDYSDYISAVVFWGVADDYSWLDHGVYNMAHPFLFDATLSPKQAFYTVFNF